MCGGECLSLHSLGVTIDRTVFIRPDRPEKTRRSGPIAIALACAGERRSDASGAAAPYRPERDRAALGGPRWLSAYSHYSESLRKRYRGVVEYGYTCRPYPLCHLASP